jgi:Carboxypeptidase regulatory-like domain
MAACPILSVTNSITRSLLLISAVCLSAADALGAPQIASLPQTISGGEYRIAGTVVSKTDGHPLMRARITVRDAKDPQKFLSIVTSDDGKFEFTGLPAGKYSLQGAKRGFISAAYDQHDQFSTAIVTGASPDTETLMLRLAPDAVISGRVLDEVGEPIRHATVTLYYEDHSRGIDQIHQSRGAQTDDQGAYEMTPLQPGTYFLSASAKPWYAVHPIFETEGRRESSPSPSVDRSLDVAYPSTYYPDVTEPESATPIPIRGGEHVQLDIHFNPVPALRLLLRVTDSGKNGVTFPQLQQSAFDSSTFVQSDGGRMVSPGLFEITGIPAGRYNLRFFGPGQGTQMDGVDLTKDGEEIDTSKSEALSTVKVSVRIPAEAALPPRLVVGLRSGPRTAAVFQLVNTKGESEFQQVAPGRYQVLVGTSGKPYSIAHMAAEGADASGHTLTVAAGSAPSVSLTLIGGSVEVQGIAKRGGNAFAGAMVVLVPKNPESDRDLFRRDQSDLDGTFSLFGVIPGFYTILAIDNGWDLDWSQPGVIAAYRKNGRAIQVGAQGARLINVAEPIEVQSK